MALAFGERSPTVWNWRIYWDNFFAKDSLVVFPRAALLLHKRGFGHWEASESISVLDALSLWGPHAVHGWI